VSEHGESKLSQAATDLLGVASEVNKLKDTLSAQLAASRQLEQVVAELGNMAAAIRSLPVAIDSVATKGLGFIQETERVLAPVQRAIDGLSELKGELNGSIAQLGRILSGKLTEIAETASKTQSTVEAIDAMRGDLFSRIEQFAVGASSRAADLDRRIQELVKLVSANASMTTRIGSLLEEKSKEETKFRQSVLDGLARLEALETRSGFAKVLGKKG